MPGNALLPLRSIVQRQLNAMQDAMIAPCRTLGRALTIRAAEVVQEWDNKPTFEYQVIERSGEITLLWKPTGPNAAIWYYVDLGTKPHIIVPVNAPKLVFQMGYVSRTAPVARFNVGPGRAFGSWRKADIVFHPGNEARQFAQTALDTLGPQWLDQENRALGNAIRRL